MKKTPIIALFFVLIISSCKKPYNNPDLKADAEYLVVEGMITDDKGPYQVILSYSKSIDGDNTYKTPARKAKVIISDDMGDQEVLTEGNPGYYHTDSAGIQGVVGRKYTLSVKTLSGDLYQSKPCILPPHAVLDSLYAKFQTKTTLQTSKNGETSKVTRNVLTCYTDISSNNSFSVRVEPELVFEQSSVESYVIQYDDGSEVQSKKPLDVFTWINININDFPDVKGSASKYNKYLIKGYEIGDMLSLNHIPLSLIENYDGYSITYTELGSSIVGRILTLKVYSLSEDSYRFYSELKNQLTATEAIFDPRPDNLIGNMICKTDSIKKVFGLFEASSLACKSFFVDWYGSSFYKFKELKTFDHNIISGSQKKDPPDFWVTEDSINYR